MSAVINRAKQHYSKALVFESLFRFLFGCIDI